MDVVYEWRWCENIIWFFDYKSIYVDFIDLYLPLDDEYFIRNGVLNEISFSSGSGLGCYVFPNSHCSGKW